MITITLPLNYAYPFCLLISLFFYSVGVEAGNEVGLAIQVSEKDFDYNDTRYTSRIDKVSLTLHEPLNNYNQAGLTIGYISLSQELNPVLSGVAMKGGFLGVILNSRLYQGNHVGLDAKWSYIYHALDSNVSSTPVTMNWHDFMLMVGVNATIGDYWFSVGVYGQRITGNEISSAPVSRTTAFSQHAGTGTYIGVDYYVDRTGKIGFQFNEDTRSSVKVIFSREY